MKTRAEKDFLGEVNIPEDNYWGVHTYRAKENFAISGYAIDRDFIKAFGLVKLACAKTVYALGSWETTKAEAIFQACNDLAEGKFDSEVIVDAMQGGAGTSLNMNVNEVIANRALEILGKNKGEYNYVDPLEDVNLYQSTNDTYPTALKIACLNKLQVLAKYVTELQDSLQEKEREFADIVKVGRTQLMDAVPITLGKEFSAFAEAVSRDRWRIYKCEERLRVVNIGGTAIGTSIGAPRKYIFGIIENLREVTGLGLARAENQVENTQNADIFSEVSGILKAHASNLIKISNDLRLMNSGPHAGFAEITLPPVQAGSSIMAGKVNPVIPEMAAQAGLKVFGNDAIISNCTAMGQFELNQFMPLIAFTMLESLNILINANKILKERCIDGIKPNRENIKRALESSHVLLTALLPKLGYHKVSQIAKELRNTNMTPKEYILSQKLLSEEDYNHLISLDAVLSMGNKI